MFVMADDISQNQTSLRALIVKELHERRSWTSRGFRTSFFSHRLVCGLRSVEVLGLC